MIFTSVLKCSSTLQPEVPPQKNQVKAQADYYINNQGEYVVHLQLLQKGASVIDLSLAAPSLSAARPFAGSGPEI